MAELLPFAHSPDVSKRIDSINQLLKKIISPRKLTEECPTGTYFEVKNQLKQKLQEILQQFDLTLSPLNNQFNLRIDSQKFVLAYSFNSIFNKKWNTALIQNPDEIISFNKVLFEKFVSQEKDFLIMCDIENEHKNDDEFIQSKISERFKASMLSMSM